MKGLIVALMLFSVTPAMAQETFRFTRETSSFPITDRALELASEMTIERQDEEGRDWLMWGLVVAYGTCVVADALTSGYAIGAEKGVEANGIYANVQNYPFRFGLRRGVLAAITPTAAWLLQKKGGKVGRNVGKVILGGSAGAYCYIAKRNSDIATR